MYKLGEHHHAVAGVKHTTKPFCPNQQFIAFLLTDICLTRINQKRVCKCVRFKGSIGRIWNKWNIIFITTSEDNTFGRGVRSGASYWLPSVTSLDATKSCAVDL